jgi:NAD(P)-dependent dehydrogenase (short-subunit alcohol dehydrogenase family)
MDLLNAVIVITGAARGIGRALAEGCLAAGAPGVLNDNDASVLADTVRRLATPAAVASAGDVS